MADNGYEYFKPEPRPEPRVRGTFFDVVPDAFSPRTIALTGDQRRSQRGSGTSTPTEPPTKIGTPVIEDALVQTSVTDVEAEKWEGVISGRFERMKGINKNKYKDRLRQLTGNKRPTGGKWRRISRACLQGVRRQTVILDLMFHSTANWVTRFTVLMYSWPDYKEPSQRH